MKITNKKEKECDDSANIIVDEFRQSEEWSDILINIIEIYLSIINDRTSKITNVSRNTPIFIRAKEAIYIGFNLYDNDVSVSGVAAFERAFGCLSLEAHFIMDYALPHVVGKVVKNGREWITINAADDIYNQCLEAAKIIILG